LGLPVNNFASYLKIRSSAYENYAELLISAAVFSNYSKFQEKPDLFLLQMKVLIVDDNSKVREVVRDYLPASVEKIYECGDGGEAFALYREHQPDWVLMDWEMPQMNGITAIRQIVSEFPNANICMVTAFDDEDIRAEALAAGASGFVLKDTLFELEEMFRVTHLCVKSSE